MGEKASEGRSKAEKQMQRMAEMGMSDFLTAVQPERKSARLSSALLDYKRPEGLNLVPIGSSWSLDLFARHHNGSRRELIDMYNMIDSMQKRIQEVRNHDLEAFLNWWDVFASYLLVSQEGEEKILIAWLEKLPNIEIPEELQKEERQKISTTIKELCESFDQIDNLLKRRAPDESMAKIIKSLVRVEPIVTYFERVESLLPAVVEKSGDAKEGKRLERQMAKYLYKNGHPSERKLHLCILGRGMTSDVLSAYRKLLPMHVRLLSHSYQAQFDKTHVSVVDRLAILGD